MNNTLKKLISLYLAALLTVSAALPAAFAEGAENEGTVNELSLDENASGGEQNNVEDSEPESASAAGENDMNPEADESSEGLSDFEEPKPEAGLEAGNVVYRFYGEAGQTGYASLSEAVSAAGDGETLTVTADMEISSRIAIGKNITITDDGVARTVYFSNTAADSTSSRGLQVNSGKSVTVAGTALGGLTLCGHGMGENAESCNYASMLFCYNGNLSLNNITVTGSRQATGKGAVCGYSESGNVSVTGCSFSGNSLASGQSSGADIYMMSNTSLALSGVNSIGDIYSSLDKPVSVSGSWNGANVGLTVPSEKLAEGTAVITGDSVDQAAGRISLIGLDNDEYYVSPITGKISTRPTALIEDVEYASLAEAVTAAYAGDTITLFKDADVPAKLEIGKSITITDDGNPRTIYVYNSSSASGSGYGQGITVKGKNITVSIAATEPGNITILGHSRDGETYNYSSVLYVNRGALDLKGVNVRECVTSSYGALRTYNDYYGSSAGTSVSNIYTGTLSLTDCVIEDNTSKANSYGAAIYNAGILNIYDGTVIRNNCSRWDKGGGIYNDVHDACNGVDIVFTGVSNLSGNVTISGNLKNCSYQEGAGVNSDGDASNIYTVCTESINVGSVTGSIGIDFAGDNPELVALCDTEGEITCLHSDNDDSVDAIGEEGFVLWKGFYELALSEAVQGAGFNYSLPNATVGIPSGRSAAALSVAVDRGFFSVDCSAEGLEALSITKITYIDAVGNYGCGAAMPEVSVFRGVSIEANWSASLAQSFIRSLEFSGDTEGMTQNISVGLAKSVAGGSVYFGGSSYSYVSEPCSYENAELSAEAAGGHLAVPCLSVTDKLLSGFFGSRGYIGGRLLSDNWYWWTGRLEGTRISVSSAGSQGYNNAYTNWAEGQPGAGNVMVLEGGKWRAAGGSSGCGYYVEAEDRYAASKSVVLSASNKSLKLTSVSLTLDEGVAVNYYLSFTDAFAESDEAYVEITVGENEAVRKYVKADIIKDENKSAYGSAYKVSIPVNAKEMNADTEIRFYGPGGRPSGSIGGSGNTQYNVCWYANNVILKKDSGDSYNAGYSSDLISLVKALLNYGAAAQLQFNYQTDRLCNSGYEDSSVMTDPDSIIEGRVEYGSGNQYYIEMIAGSSTIMRIRPVTDAGFTATVDGVGAGVAAGSEGSYIEIPVSVDKLTRTYTVEFTGGFEDTLSLNAAGVIKAMLQSGSDTQKTTCDRLYKLSKAANGFFGVYTPSVDAVESVINTAYAYLEKSEYIDYDQRPVTDAGFLYTGYVNSRRRTDASPEEATAQNRIYMDCSSFCYNVYREVFGSDAVFQALGVSTISDMVTGELIGCNTASLAASYSTADIDFPTLRALLQPGDLIVKYRSGSDSHGHIVLWTGSGYIHCTGTSYNYSTGRENTDEGGAVHFVPAESFTADWYKGFNTVTVLRPLNMLASEEISSVARGRQQLGPMAVSKTAATVSGTELYRGRRVITGDTVEYTITLSNRYMQGTMNTARCVTVTDSIPSGTELISAEGAVRSGSVLKWSNVSVAPGETIRLCYSVRVTASSGSVIAPGGGSCVCSEAGSSAGAVDFAFPYSISVEQSCDSIANSIVNAACNLRDTACENGCDTINGIIGAAVPGASLCSEDSEWVSAIFEAVTKYPGYFYVKDFDSQSAPGKYLVANFATGRKVVNHSHPGGQFDTATRMRMLTVNNLELGDIIAVYSGSKYIYYVFISDCKMVKISSGETVTLLNDEEVPATLTALLTKDCFAVFRIPGRA